MKRHTKKTGRKIVVARKVRRNRGIPKPQKGFGAFLSILSGPLAALERWQSTWGIYEQDETLDLPSTAAKRVLSELQKRLTDNYPFFHPMYAGQMLKPPHPIASVAYFLTQQINPNNHALDGGPATAKMEMEVIDQLAGMVGYDKHLGHLTSSGTIANLEALWVARSLHPEKSIAFSAEAHYTHRRMCDVIGVRPVAIRVDNRGRMDLDDLRKKLKEEDIGTVVMTAGTTGLGAVDPIVEALGLRKEFGFRIHVDAAYGGFFLLIADIPGLLEEETRLGLKAISQSDSVVIDPHKHGLQPYGCGSVIFPDPAIGRLYKHDSPYTYFTSAQLHLGEISLECSRAGASAAALWTTLKCFPLKATSGLGAILTKTRKAAIGFSDTVRKDGRFRLVTDPSLDIVAYYPVGKVKAVSAISKQTERVFETTMTRENAPLFLAKMTLKPEVLSHHADLIWDQLTMTVLRSVFMKPEHLKFVPEIYSRLLKSL